MAAEAEAELRMRAQSWASPPGTRGWPARCGRRPRQMGLWGQRRSACRPRTGSRRVRTGPRWKAGGSGGGTRGRCSHGHPGDGEGTVRGAAAAGSPGPRGGGPGCTRSNPRCSPGRWVVGAGPCPEPWTSLPPCMRSGSAQGPLAPLTNFIPTSHEWSCPGSALKSNFPFTWPQDHLGSGPCRPSNWKATPGHSHLLVPWPSSPTLQV